jgi:hypothetical protein
MPEQDAVQVTDSDESLPKESEVETFTRLVHDKIGISVADAKALLVALEPALQQIWREKNVPPDSPPQEPDSPPTE